MLETLANMLMSYGFYGLIIGTFLEAIISPIIPEVFLIPMVLARPNEYILIGLATAASSTVGGIGGYYLGYFGGRPIFEKLFKREYYDKALAIFEKYDVWAVFIAGFTPVPYKVFTILGGIFKMNLFRFTFASFLSRGLRFMLEAVLIGLYGRQMADYILSPTFAITTIIIVAVLILVYYLLRRSRTRN